MYMYMYHIQEVPSTHNANCCLLFIQFSQVSLQRKFFVQIRSVN